MGESSSATVGRIVRLALLALVVVVAATAPAAAHSGDAVAHHHDGRMGSHDGMGWGGLVLWPALLVLVAGVAAYALLRQPSGSDDAMATLRERYARGEIDEDEFQQRRETLRTDER